MVSVILLTYNSELEEIIYTLDSIIEQKGVKFELIIADDGSLVNNQKDIEDYLLRKDFYSYKILCQNENVGTVKNLIKALEISKGTYIKAIAPGDILLEDTSLLKIFKFMEDDGGAFGFAKMLSYIKEDGNDAILHKPYRVPRSIAPYKNNNLKKVKRNIILYRDFISGASMFAKRDELLEELLKLSSTVKYCEDFIQIQMALEGKKFSFFNENIVLYECSQGISNVKMKNEVKSKVQIDYENYIRKLNREYKDNLLRKRQLLNELQEIKNPLLRIVRKFLCVPGLYLFSILYKKM